MHSHFSLQSIGGTIQYTTMRWETCTHAPPHGYGPCASLITEKEFKQRHKLNGQRISRAHVC